ncbi:MAG TPA: hypothetical protein VHP58_01695 [Alphaproteobacteria bacterium]|nr:hypothetical protein [Alphaproteobacteria bacterium]
MGNEHEIIQPGPINETIMDKYNNGIGSTIGQNIKNNGGSIGDIGPYIKQALDHKRLITDPNSSQVQTIFAEQNEQQRQKELVDISSDDSLSDDAKQTRRLEANQAFTQRQVEFNKGVQDWEIRKRPQDSVTQAPAGGDVQVSAYDRSNGHVNAYTRRRPD